MYSKTDVVATISLDVLLRLPLELSIRVAVHVPGDFVPAPKNEGSAEQPEQ